MMQAILLVRSETSKPSIFLAPLSLLRMRVQVGSTPQPSGDTMPRPVTTTRLISSTPAQHSRPAKRDRWSARRRLLGRPQHRASLQLFAFFSRNFVASPTVKIVSAASSGISQPNSSSNAITSSTVSRLSAPRSSIKLADSVTLSGSTPRCSTTIFLTRSAMFSLIASPSHFSHGLSRATRAVVAEGGERALPVGSFDGPQLPGCPDQAAFGYHTSPTLQSTHTSRPQHCLSARLITQIAALPSAQKAVAMAAAALFRDLQNRLASRVPHEARAA